MLLRHARNAWVGLGTLAFVTVSLLPFMPERPWHFTIFFTTLTLHSVLRIRDGCPLRRFAWLPVLYVVWANVHIQFVMGFALLGLGWLTTLIEWRRGGGQDKKTAMARLFVLGAACTAATFATPFHFRLYVVIWEYASQTQALALVSELAPPTLFKWWNVPLVVLLATASAVVLWRRFPLWDLILLASAFFSAYACKACDLWFGVLIAGTIIVRNLWESEKQEGEVYTACRVFAHAPPLALLVMRFAWTIGLSQGKTFTSCHAESYPVGAAAYIHDNHVPGPLFNNFDWGGYLIWAAPETPREH